MVAVPKSKSVTLELNFKIVPKARPRTKTINGRSYTYMPKTYERCKSVIISVIKQSRIKHFKRPVKLAIYLSQKSARTNADLDNIAGTIMDALVESGILADDTLKHIPSLKVEATGEAGNKTIIKLWEV